MKTRSYQKLHDYVLGNLADIKEIVEKKPEEHRAAFRALKHKEMNDFFDPLMIGGAPLSNFLGALFFFKSRYLGSILFNSLQTDSYIQEIAARFPEDKAIETRFQQFEDQHAFFLNSRDAALNQFYLYFKIAKFIADCVELNNTVNDDAAYTHAYKLLVLFGDKPDPKKIFRSFDVFLATHNFHEKNTPLHDALLYSLPKNKPNSTPIHLAQWRDIIHKAGPKACRIFGKAAEIEEKLGGHAPRDFREAFETGKLITYKNIAADPELAELCMLYDISETIFNRCLEIKKQTKTRDKLPQVTVDGKEVDKPGYHLVKLPINDPRAFILGHITDCCQSIGGHSETCVIDGITREHNGFYVLLKEKKKVGILDKKKEEKETKSLNDGTPYFLDKNGTLQIDYSHYDIIGQGYAWLSIWGNLVFDSWENLRPAKAENKNLQDDAVIVPMLKAFAKKVVEQKDSTIFRVCIGQGGKTPAFYEEEENIIETLEIMTEGTQYGDSEWNQSLIYCNEKKRDALYEEIVNLAKKHYNQKFQYGLLSSLSKELIVSEEIANFITLLFQENAAIQYYSSNTLTALARSNKWSFNYIWIAAALLHQVGMCTERNIQYISFQVINLPNTFYKSSIAAHQAIITLYREGLLKDYFKRFILFKDGQRWTGAAKSLALLKSEGVLNPAHESIIFTDKEHTFTICKALVKLTKADLWTAENKSIVTNLPFYAEASADVIYALAQKQTSEQYNYDGHFPFIITNHPMLAKLIIKHKVLSFDKLLNFFTADRGNLASPLLESVLEADIPINDKSTTGCTLLNCVAKYDQGMKLVAQLIDRRADINFPDNEGATPLLNSIKYNQREITALLLECKDIIIEKEKLLDSKYVDAPASNHGKLVAQAMVALHESKLLNANNFKYLTSRLTTDKCQIINTLFAANLLNERTFAFVKSMMCLEAFRIFIVGLAEARLNLAEINFENPTNLDLHYPWYWTRYTMAYKILTPSIICTPENINIILQSDPKRASTTAKIIAQKRAENLNYLEEFLLALNAGPDRNLSLAKYIAEHNLVNINEIKNINANNKQGESLLLIALKNQQESIAHFILQHKKIKIEDNHSTAVTPLLLAIKYGYKNIMLEILQKTGFKNINRGNKYGITPLIQAITYKQFTIAVLLLGISHTFINAQNCDGNTPLHTAVAGGDAKMINLLLDLGADPTIKNKWGLMPMGLTKNGEIHALLNPISDLGESREMKYKA